MLVEQRVVWWCGSATVLRMASEHWRSAKLRIHATCATRFSALLPIERTHTHSTTELHKSINIYMQRTAALRTHRNIEKKILKITIRAPNIVKRIEHVSPNGWIERYARTVLAVWHAVGGETTVENVWSPLILLCSRLE